MPASEDKHSREEKQHIQRPWGQHGPSLCNGDNEKASMASGELDKERDQRGGWSRHCKIFLVGHCQDSRFHLE